MSSYITFDFDDLTQKGLKALIDELKRKGQTLVDFSGSNRATKKDGQKIKTAKLFFDSGQSVTIAVNSTGDLTQVKMNSTVLPVTKLNKLSEFASELASKLGANQEKFEKSLARQAAKAIKDESSKRPAGRTLEKRIQEAQAAQLESNENLSKLKAHRFELSERFSSLTSRKSQVKSLIESHKQAQNKLIEQITELGADPIA